MKVFNTGKLEIPGIQNDDVMDTILGNQILKPYTKENLQFYQIQLKLFYKFKF